MRNVFFNGLLGDASAELGTIIRWLQFICIRYYSQQAYKHNIMLWFEKKKIQSYHIHPEYKRMFYQPLIYSAMINLYKIL